MTFIAIVSRWFWLIMIAATTINVVTLWLRSNCYRKQNAKLTKGYLQIATAILVLGNIPWIILGVGTVSGSISDIWQIFNLKEMTVYGFTFYLSAVSLGLIYNYFVFFRSGDNFLLKHPGLLRHGLDHFPGIWKLIGVSVTIAHIVFFVFLFSVPYTEIDKLRHAILNEPAQ